MHGIDLHAHTTASDGDHSPTELVAHAADLGLAALAVTDHDTIDGISEAQQAGERYGVEVVAGVELSVETTVGQFHLLGYFIDPLGSTLAERLHQLRENRRRRNEHMIGKLQQLGLQITFDEVRSIAGGEVVARPHFARLLVAKGYVKTTQEAFDRYLADGASGHVPKDKLNANEALGLVHAAGGLAILAHPNNLKRDPEGTEVEIVRLQELGLDGIEARYSRHTPEDTARYLALAERHRLLTTGGSDFHGPTVKPNIHLGHVEGGGPAPYALLEAIKAVREKRLAQVLSTSR